MGNCCVKIDVSRAQNPVMQDELGLQRLDALELDEPVMNASVSPEGQLSQNMEANQSLGDSKPSEAAKEGRSTTNAPKSALIDSESPPGLEKSPDDRTEQTKPAIEEKDC